MRVCYVYASALDPLELRRTKSMPKVGSGYADRRDPSYGSPYRVCRVVENFYFSYGSRMFQLLNLPLPITCSNFATKIICGILFGAAIVFHPIRFLFLSL